MNYSQDISPALSASLGKEGASPKRLQALKAKLNECADALRVLRIAGELPMLEIPSRSADLDEIEAHAKQIRDGFTHFVVLGMGGSSLGGETLAALAHNPFAAPRMHFVDNMDPHTLDLLFATLDVKRSFFFAVSKSGSTVETLSQLLIAHEKVAGAVGEAKAREHFTVITVKGESPLRRFAEEKKLTLIDHDPKLGGRFSVFSAVGLLPAAVAGLDIKALRQGAAAVTEQAFATDGQGGLPGEGAALAVALAEQGKSISVLMPYCDRLYPLSRWYRQTWAESVGKDGKGSTPVQALGATDQHSQLQLYLNGPRDKFITFILLDNKGQGPFIPLPHDGELTYLAAKHAGDVIEAQQRATAETLQHNNCPVRVIRLSILNEQTLGSLVMHFMLETIFAAHLLGVNAFDQPAVEESKILARAYLAGGSKV